jgi:hypothetical protein
MCRSMVGDGTQATLPSWIGKYFEHTFLLAVINIHTEERTQIGQRRSPRGDYGLAKERAQVLCYA